MAKLSESPFQSPFCSLHKGTSVLLNVFQRADDNDNGLLSRQEFIDFFFDGILTEDELIDIFDEVDLHHNGNINSSDLCTFLWMHLGIFEPALAALEDLSLSVSQASSSVDKLYKRDSVQTQFVTRFMVKEIQHQLTGVQQQLQALSSKLEEDVIPVIDRKSPPVVTCKNRFPIIPRVKPIRLKKQMVTQTSLHIEDTSQDLDAQVRKLEKLVRQLENQPLLKKTMEVDIDENEEKLLLLVQQSLPAETSAIEQFRESLKIYAEETKIMEGCLHVCIKWYNTVTTFVVYEVWDSETVWNNHVRSKVYKRFQHQNVDCLRKPEFVSVMEIPASWWQSES